MKNLLIKALKISLIAVLVILTILLVFGLVLWLDWPWWLGIVLLLIISGLCVGGLFLRKILLRKREQQFVQKVIEEDEARLKRYTEKEREEMKALQDRWKEAVETLRRSHLKRFGNPLYVLPWYLVMGESGSGKTTAIGSAKLTSPFVEVKRASGISGTRNCDWWFFEQAVIIDTAGRYAIPVDEGRDKDEWQRFLNLLVKYRKKEPIHGLIVTVSADKLLSASSESLEDDGRSIRRRIDELMRVLGVKFPVYVLVTKCDLIQGMTRFTECLPEKSLDQPMGFINQQLSKDVDGFLNSAMGTIGDRLRYLRMLILHRPESATVDPALLLFPEELEQVRRGLDPFARAAFQENPYQETPALRGIFFSSGRQEGSPYSHFLEALGLIEEKEVLPGTNKGLFLHEFFARILPADQRLFAPTTRTLEWRAITRNLGLIAWILLVVAMCGILSFSFVKNLRTIRAVGHQFSSLPVLRGDALSDLATMERFRQSVEEVERRNRNWWIPRFGLNESIKVEVGLKSKYCKQFRDGFLRHVDRQISDVMPKLAYSGFGSDDVFGQYVVHLVRRINLLKARLEGIPYDQLREKPQPSYVSLLSPEQTFSPEGAKKFGLLYLSYLSWRTDTTEISEETALLQSWLRELLKARSGNLSWLVGWVDKESGLPPVTFADFWGGGAPTPGEAIISAAYTQKGKAMIDELLKEVEAALPDQSVLETQKTAFNGHYRSWCFDTWRTFMVAFPRGTEKLKGAREWRQMAARMNGDRAPYYAFLNKAALELQPLARGEGVPAWLQQVYEFQIAKAQGYLKGQGAIARVTEEGRRFVAGVERKVGGEIKGGTLDARLAAGRACYDLMSALGAIAPAAGARRQAYQLAAQVFTEEPGLGRSHFYTGYGAAGRLKANLAQGQPVDEAVSRMLTGPLDFLWTCVRMEAACYLQNQWEEKVLAESQGATGQQAMQMLLGPEGPVWRFVKGSGPAAPFIGWSFRGGYRAKEALGTSISFEPAFFTFLVKGAKVHAAAVSAQAKPSSNTVTIKGLPTDTNPEAKIKPHSTKLELQCENSTQTLVNYHYPISKAFSWSPDTCADVLFQIEVGDIILSKHYGGPRAFPDFLRDFKNGRRTFFPREFPGEKVALGQLGIKYITVNYRFSGEAPIVGQAESSESLPGQAVWTIVRCWAE